MNLFEKKANEALDSLQKVKDDYINKVQEMEDLCTEFENQCIKVQQENLSLINLYKDLRVLLLNEKYAEALELLNEKK